MKRILFLTGARRLYTFFFRLNDISVQEVFVRSLSCVNYPDDIPHRCSPHYKTFLVLKDNPNWHHFQTMRSDASEKVILT